MTTSKYPKFEQAIRENIVDAAEAQKAQPGYGIILDYDPTYHTATVMMADAFSDQPGELLYGVMCPTTVGLQVTAPEPGRPCWVVFRANDRNNAMITHFFNHVYHKIDYIRNTEALNTIPRYMLGM